MGTLVACDRSPDADEARDLERDVGALLATHCGGGERVDIPAAQWPSSVSALRPKRVSIIVGDGLYIETSTTFVESQGIYIRCPALPPVGDSPGTDPSFRAIEGRVFSYHIKG